MLPDEVLVNELGAKDGLVASVVVAGRVDPRF